MTPDNLPNNQSTPTSASHALQDQTVEQPSPSSRQRSSSNTDRMLFYAIQIAFLRLSAPSGYTLVLFRTQTNLTIGESIFRDLLTGADEDHYHNIEEVTRITRIEVLVVPERFGLENDNDFEVRICYDIIPQTHRAIDISPAVVVVPEIEAMEIQSGVISPSIESGIETAMRENGLSNASNVLERTRKRSSSVVTDEVSLDGSDQNRCILKSIKVENDGDPVKCDEIESVIETIEPTLIQNTMKRSHSKALDRGSDKRSRWSDRRNVRSDDRIKADKGKVSINGHEVANPIESHMMNKRSHTKLYDEGNNRSNEWSLRSNKKLKILGSTESIMHSSQSLVDISATKPTVKARKPESTLINRRRISYISRAKRTANAVQSRLRYR